MRRIVVGMAIFTFALLAPAIASANDEKIADHIYTQLAKQQKEGKLRGFKINLKVKEGSVHMKGRVSTAEQRKMVLNIAAHTVGVRQVINEMEIKKNARPAKKATEKPASPKTSKPKIAKKSGIPNLFSAVSGLTRLTPTSKKPAITIKKPVVKKAAAKVQRVSARKATKSSKAADERIAGDIIRKLSAKKDAGKLRNFKLDVHVDHGIVWVKGRVASQENHQMVMDVARRVPGVKKVVNDLAVRKSVRRPALRADLVSAKEEQPQPRVVQAPRPLGPVGTSALPGRSLVPQMPAVNVAPQRLGYPQPQYRYPIPVAPAYSAQAARAQAPRPMPSYRAERAHASRARYDHPSVPRHAWPSYAPHPNYAALTYPRQYSPTVWPYMGPFYPYPQVPLGWRKVTLEWDDGLWMLNFKSR